VSIAIVGMLDEREAALRVIKGQIESRGHRAVLIDVTIGSGANVPSLKADVGCDEVSKRGGGSIDEIRRMPVKEREKVVSIMGEGVKKTLLKLHSDGELQGVIAIAGMTGTFITLPAMKALPFGIPKLLISSSAAMPAYGAKLAEYFGLRDITVMHPVVDTVGMNPLVRVLAMNGANAICGMIEGFEPLKQQEKPSIALTEFGGCEQGAHYIRELLGRDYELVSFHATGLGDQAAVELVGQGIFQAFIDLVPASFSEYLLGGNRGSGPNRLDGAVNQSIPYILAPCGFDLLSCGPLERRDKGDPLWTSRKLAERKLLVLDAFRVQARTSPEEMETLARAVAEKLSKYTNKRMVKFVIPKKGFSGASNEGASLYDPIADKTFLDELKRYLDPEIKTIEVDTHINTPEFAHAVVEALQESFDTLKLAVQ